MNDIASNDPIVIAAHYQRQAFELGETLALLKTELRVANKTIDELREENRELAERIAFMQRQRSLAL